MKFRHFIIVVFLCALPIHSQVQLAHIFSDNMVLQRNVKIPIWGWAKSNEKITVSFHSQVKTTQADTSGKWMVYLDSESAGGPFELEVKASNTLLLKNIVVGEVWLCSGQSNMEWTVGQSDHAADEIAHANYPLIRHIKINKEINSIPNSDIKSTTWQVCSPETVSDFSGVAYYYAKQLQDKLHVPIGLINASWGGTNIETWISREGFEGDDEFKNMIATMPKTDFKSLLELKLKSSQQRIETIEKAPFTTVNIPNYKNLDFDDSKWPEIQEPQLWEEQVLGNFDGIVWLRKKVVLTKAQIDSGVTLEIPAIDDNDITYVNGVKVGETMGWDIKRVYAIPASQLLVGENSIAVRVDDYGGGGGMYGKASGLKLVCGQDSIALNGLWKFKVEFIKDGLNENEFPSLCYNAMIHPLLPFAFQGVLWYQGETNASRAFQYRKSFPLLITNWRQLWKRDFPFYYVQLATFTTYGNSNEGCAWAELREAQSRALQLANTGMVVTTDIGNPASIHPINKQEVGKRLSAIALNSIYGTQMVCNGPSFKSVDFKDNQAMVSFDSIGTGLITFHREESVYGFEIAGENQVFYKAKAFLNSDNVVVYSEDVKNPKAVRYAWIGDASSCNLFNKEGFPAVPFRSDDWKTSTTLMKYEISTQKK